MKKTFLIAVAGTKTNLRSVSTVVIMTLVILMCAASLVIALCVLVIAPAVESPVPDINLLQTQLSVAVFGACLIGVGINMNVFTQTIIKEKSRGNITALLATPLEMGNVLAGKSLAVFLPGLVMGTILGLVTLLVVNFIYLVPNVGFLINPWMVASSFVAVPLIYLGLSLLAHIIGLAGKPVTANVIIQVFLPVYASAMINLGVRDILNAASWEFTLANLGVAALIGLLVVLLRPRLTIERVVLSS
jgi:ABC-type Na+ efflux pump permease subunit